MIETITSTTAITDTIGAWLGRNMLFRMKIGSVVTPDPAVNVVTMISSNDQREREQPAREQRRAQLRERDQPERRPHARRRGRPTPPRGSCPVRRRRAITLLNTVTMQNVACAITTVQIESGTPMIVRKKLFSAIPVMMPGSAIGRMISRLIASRPKN